VAGVEILLSPLRIIVWGLFKDPGGGLGGNSHTIPKIISIFWLIPKTISSSIGSKPGR
jgi:hypothetical protein